MACVPRWFIILLVAIITESIYLLISLGCSNLIKDQRHWVDKSSNPCARYATKLVFSLTYASIAFLMTYLMPSSAGSGIPEVKVGDRYI